MAANGDGKDGSGPRRPGPISKVLEQLARPPEGSPGEWAFPAVGTSIGRFDLLREIGRGGFGVVYEARDRELDRVVAIKVIRPGPKAVAEARGEWLQREAVTAARLSHPNIVTLHDRGTGEQGPYLVLEMLHGETLQERLARGPLAPAEAVAVGLEVARALAHAHAQKVLHRDLKPSNVFLTEEGEVKVLDFGLAHFVGTSAMRGGGTPGYMAPEQLRGDAEDPRTDVFGLGVLLFEMLSGRLPYRVSRDRSEVLDPGPPPALPRQDVPPALAALVARAIDKDPGRRPRDGRAMLDALAEVQRALAPAGARAARRGRWIAAGVAAAGVAIAAAVIIPRPSPPPSRIPVVVADLVNDTGDPELENLQGLLITSLQQSELLDPLTRQRMLDVLARAGKGGADRIDEALGREIGRWTQAGALLLPTIHRLGDVYVMEMRVVDPSSDKYLFALKEEGRGKPTVFGLIDRLSDRARRGLREREAALRRSSIKVEDAVTHSLAAYQHYYRSQECMFRPSFGQRCAGELHQALAEDPTFALAHYQLAVWGERHGGARADQQAATEAAVRYLDRVPPKERILIRAWKAHFDGRDDQALALLKQRVEIDPADVEVVWEAGDLLYHRSEFEGAVPYFERVLALDPVHGWGLEHLVHSLGALRRRDELRRRVAGWASVPQSTTTLKAISAAEVWLGDFPAAVAAARREAEAGGGLSALEDLLFAGIAAGDYRGIERELSGLARPGSEAPDIGYYALAVLDAYQGRRRQGLARFDAMARELGEEAEDTIFHSVKAQYLAGDGRPGPVWEEARRLLATDPNAASAHAVTLAWLGDLEHAAALAAQLRPGSPRHQTYQAVVAWQRGEREEALRQMRAVAARSPFDADMGLAPAFLHAEMAARSGADQEAVEALADFRSLFLPIMVWRSWAYPRSLHLSAASLERLGRRAEALEQVDRLLADWRGADPGLPLLREAQALRARLAPGRDSARPAAR